MLFSFLYVSARALFQDWKTAPMAPHSCSRGSSGKSTFNFSFDERLEGRNQLFQVIYGELRVELDAPGLFLLIDDPLEGVFLFLALGFQAEHHVSVHGDEAAAAVPGEPLVPGQLGESLHRLRVEAEIEDSVHHARHAGPRPRSDGEEERVFWVAEAHAHRLFHVFQVLEDLFFQTLGELHPLVIEEGADFRGNGEAGGHGYAEIDHLGEACAFPSEEVPQALPPFGLFSSKKIDILTHRFLLP